VRIVLETTILVRATESSHRLARELLLNIVASKHTLLLSTEMLYELARVLRYPRLQAFYGLTEERTYDFVRYLHEVAEIVSLTPLLAMPIRGVNDIVALQTAVNGEANILRTRDEDFYDPVATGFLSKVGITVMDDISLMHCLLS
jgi:putative PIN family toxin of toxin-antitoxin system